MREISKHIARSDRHIFVTEVTHNASGSCNDKNLMDNLYIRFSRGSAGRNIKTCCSTQDISILLNQLNQA